MYHTPLWWEGDLILIFNFFITAQPGFVYSLFISLDPLGIQCDMDSVYSTLAKTWLRVWRPHVTVPMHVSHLSQVTQALLGRHQASLHCSLLYTNQCISRQRKVPLHLKHQHFWS